MLDRVPAEVRRPGGPRLDSFYGGDLATWRHVLGPRLHYHHGLFDETLAPDMDAALDRAVTELYPFIPARGRLYDIGCGWGGALGMWIRDLRCTSLGLTISRAQFRYAAGRGLPVRWGDAELTLPPGYFDCAVLLESFEHIVAKQRLLQVLRMFAGRLVMRVQRARGRCPVFPNTQRIHAAQNLLCSMLYGGVFARHPDLTVVLEEMKVGWVPSFVDACARQAMPSVAHWHSRAGRACLVRDAHLDALRAWSVRVLSAPAEWAAANPLVEVVAEPG